MARQKRAILCLYRTQAGAWRKCRALDAKFTSYSFKPVQHPFGFGYAIGTYCKATGCFLAHVVR